MQDRRERQREIQTRREAIVSGCPECWNEMIRQWKAPRTDDAVWLTYSANYLFNTRGLKWAVDPVSLGNRVPEAPALDAGPDLGDLELVLLTHSHVDHVDIELWKRIENPHCHWVVPEHMIDSIDREFSLNDRHYSTAVPEEEITVAGLHITPFDAPHYERRATGGINHVSSTGYAVVTPGGSYLFPGDIRTYDPACLDRFTDVSVVFAHVFLGRSAALACDPPLLDAFVDFYLSCRPHKIVLSHLYELAREPEDCWVTSHAQIVADAVRAADSRIAVTIPEWYQEIIL